MRPKAKRRGASLVECALLIALVAVVSIVALDVIGKESKCKAYKASCATSISPDAGGLICYSRRNPDYSHSGPSVEAILAGVDAACGVWL